MSATTLVEAIRTKKISPVEAVDALYKRIHELNPRINDLSVESDGRASGFDSLRIHSRRAAGKHPNRWSKVRRRRHPPSGRRL
jgi:hypothetical protein